MKFNFIKSILLGLSSILFIIVLSCQKSLTALESGNIAIKISIDDNHLAKKADREETLRIMGVTSGKVIITGSGMNRMESSLSINTNRNEFSGTVSNVPAGNNRNVRVELKDGSGYVLYEGEDETNVRSGETANVYIYFSQNSYTITIQSTNPNSGVPITVSVADINGDRDGNTPFTRSYLIGQDVRFSAPTSFNGNDNPHWETSVSGWTDADNSILIQNYYQNVTATVIYENANSGPETGTMTDQDGNTYKTVKIGNKWWMAENLKVTHYRNGDPIPNVTDSGIWKNLTTGANCSYQNNSGYISTYGMFYNWFAVNDSRSIAPAGWHVASDAEWQALIDFVGGDCGKLKEAGTAHWNSPNTGATNESGFTALGAGIRAGDGNYAHMGNQARFFTSTLHTNPTYVWDRALLYNSTSYLHTQSDKHYGFSIRCVKD
ncbi:MAG: fibrobacter succinogenes major paralogous domain-containing protein [Bacteroidales bacterium]|nr:fibrobacter succinogenes major paralogous domain-containing protein [Bacteroidales bacterium]